MVTLFSQPLLFKLAVGINQGQREEAEMLFLQVIEIRKTKLRTGHLHVGMMIHVNLLNWLQYRKAMLQMKSRT